MTTREQKQAMNEAWCHRQYEVELAQGASHIGSMLYTDTIQSAIVETARAFETLYGRKDLLIFLSALAQKLEGRKRPEAVSALRRLIDPADITELAFRQTPTLVPPTKASSQKTVRP